MENKFTDNEIIKALECCIKVDACHECPYVAACLDDKYVSIIAKDALDLINRQKAEIEDLKADVIIAKKHEKDAKELLKDASAEIKRLQNYNENLKYANVDLSNNLLYKVEQAKSEARKEFAELIKQSTTDKSIDELLEEMEGEEVG